VDVFIGRAFGKNGRGGFGANRIERVDDLRALIAVRIPTRSSARANACDRDIALDQPPVEVQRVTESLEDFTGSGLESPPRASYGLAGREPALRSARANLDRRPIKLINPNASFWS